MPSPQTLAQTLARYAQASRRAIPEILRDAAKRFAKAVAAQTPPLIRGVSRKQHTQTLRERILERRLPRGKIPKARLAQAHMSAAEARAYFRVAQRRQGEMIGGWNALAAYSGAKLPNWISRHGKKHGRVRLSSAGDATALVSEFQAQSGRGFDTRRAEARALETVRRGFELNADHILKKKFKR